MTGHVDLVGHIGHIKSEVIYKISKVDFFVRVKTEPDKKGLLNNELALLSGNTRYSSHDLIDIGRAVIEIVAQGGVVEDFSDVFHGVWAIVWRQRTRLSHWVDVPHVSEDWRRRLSDLAQSIVNLLVS